MDYTLIAFGISLALNVAQLFFSAWLIDRSPRRG